jgi:DNA mismatch endonuclease (patch repair protein)
VKSLRRRQSASFCGLAPSSAAASRVGKGNRATDTKPELQLRSLLWSQGFRYRLHARAVPGRPDLIFIRKKVAVFCDGDFWHGRDWNSRSQRLRQGSNAKYWIAKIEGNMRRDRAVNLALAKLGWSVIRLWEGDIRANPNRCADRIGRILMSRRAPGEKKATTDENQDARD